jgi:hypothetical protein
MDDLGRKEGNRQTEILETVNHAPKMDGLCMESHRKNDKHVQLRKYDSLGQKNSPRRTIGTKVSQCHEETNFMWETCHKPTMTGDGL